MIKVLHVAPTPFFSDRGCHIRIKGIVDGLEKLQTKNIVATYHHGREIDGIRTVRTAVIPGYTKVDAGPSPFKYLADILLFCKVLSLIYKERPDIIHGHLHEGVLIGWAANLCFFRRRIPLLFDMQGSLVGELEAYGYFNKFKFLKKLFWFIEYLITRLPDVFMCSSNDSVQVLIERFNIASDKITLASDGADITEVSHRQTIDLQSRLKLPPNRAVVIYAGALSEAKGLGVLCELIKASRDRGLNCFILVVGYPADEIRRFVSDNDLDNNCLITGRVPFEELSEYLSCADIAVEPKQSNTAEASGKLLNYMGAGLPVLCFKTPNNVDMLENTGHYASGQDADSLIAGLSEMLDNPDAAEKSGKAAKARLQEYYSWDRTASVIYSRYLNCLDRDDRSMSTG